MNQGDPVSLLSAAIARRFEVRFVVNGMDLTVEPYVVYDAADGTLTLSGILGRGIPVHIPVLQMKNLTITTRSFQVDPTFDLTDARYDKAHAIIKGP